VSRGSNVDECDGKLYMDQLNAISFKEWMDMLRRGMELWNTGRRSIGNKDFISVRRQSRARANEQFRGMGQSNSRGECSN
jgi:hypothetical protein